MGDSDFASAVLGGLLVAAGCSFHIYFRQRTTSFNSVIFSIVSCEKPSIFWKSFMVCAILWTSCMYWGTYSAFDSDISLFDSAYLMVADLSLLGFAISGFLVGFGARMSHGCTTGHLFCGIPRRSFRSLVATLIYMGTAFIIAMIRYDEPFLDDTETAWVGDTDYQTLVYTLSGITLLILIVVPVYIKCMKDDHEMFRTMIYSLLIGLFITSGMIFGGLNRRSKVIGFLTFTDGSLGVFFASVLLFNLLSFYYLTKKRNIAIIETPPKEITWRLVLGSIIFGLGWGIGGLCPGPALILSIFMTPHITFIWLPCLVLGQFSVTFFEKAFHKITNLSVEEQLLNYE